MRQGRGRAEEPLESLRAIAHDVRGGAIAECGHFIPEEQPALLAQRLLAFFGA
jgi:microsomal epoxide hydrolase